MATLFFLLVVFCLAPLRHTAVADGVSEAVPMKKFTVDLDKPPEQRWVELISHYKSSVPLIVDYFDQEAPKLERELLDKIMGDLDGLLGELGKEMRAIADYWQIDLGIVVTLNFAYELRRLGGGHPNTTTEKIPASPIQLPKGIACTSIVAQDGSGNVFHGRNLDWNLPDDLRNLTVQADFLKNGEVIFTGDVTAGFVGILTGMSKAGYSISVNERDLGGNIVLDALQAVLRRAWSPTHLVRQVLTTVSSYNEAIELLGMAPLTAPTYFITAGSVHNQGAVLTRDRNHLANLWSLNVSSAVPSSWYLLETNYDHWKTVDPRDNRRYYGNIYMTSLGQEKAASMAGLYSVLGVWPIRNEYTTYTTIMYPREYRMQSYDVYI